MANGVSTTNLDRASLITELIANGEDGTVLISYDDLTTLLAGSGAVADKLAPLKLSSETLEATSSDQETRLSVLEDGTYADAIPYATSAAGIADTVEGQRFKVDNADPDVAYDVFLHDAGDVAVFVESQPSVAALAKKVDETELNRRIGAGVSLQIMPLTSGYLFGALDKQQRMGFAVDLEGRLEAILSDKATVPKGALPAEVLASLLPESSQVTVPDDGSGVFFRVTVGSDDMPRVGFELRNDGTFWFSPADDIVWPDNFFADLVDVPDVPTSSGTVIGIGDSMIASGSGVATQLSALVTAGGGVYVDQGIGGQREHQCAARLGVIPLEMTLSGDIPTSGTLSVSAVSYDLLRGPSGYDAVRAMRIHIVGFGAATLVFDPDLSAGSGGYYVIPTVYPTAPITVNSPAVWYPTSLFVKSSTDASGAMSIEDARDCTIVYRAGRNDINKGVNVPDLLGYDKDLAGFLRPMLRRMVMMGVTNGISDLPSAFGGAHSTEAESFVALQEHEDINAQRADFFGASEYFDVMAHYENRGEVSGYVINGKAFRVLDMGLADSMHEGEAQKAAMAQAIYDFLTLKGL